MNLTVTIDDPKAYVKPWTNRIAMTVTLASSGKLLFAGQADAQ